MTTSELAKQVKQIEIKTRKAVVAAFAGEYRSAFKGQGMEFDEVREYQPGDDIRTIDWTVSARTGKLHTKQFVEERELTVMLAVDLSGSGEFGSGEKSRQQLAAEVAALLAFSAIKNNDRVGLAIFTETIELFIPPRKGSTHVLRLIRELLAFKPRRRGTRIGRTLQHLFNILKRRSVVFLISDFMDSDFESPLRVMSQRHDLIAVSLEDTRETELPRAGLIELVDAETGERMVLDTAAREVRRRYTETGARRKEELKQLLSTAGVDQVSIKNGEDIVRPLVRLFNARERRH